jgi:hypothetical protein
MLPLAETILADASFFCMCVETMGWDWAVELHVEDCVKLQYCIHCGISSVCQNSSYFPRRGWDNQQ